MGSRIFLLPLFHPGFGLDNLRSCHFRGYYFAQGFSLRNPGRSRYKKPCTGLHKIFVHPIAIVIEHAQIDLSCGIVLIGSVMEPLGSLHLVRGYSCAVEVTKAEGALCLGISLFSPNAEDWVLVAAVAALAGELAAPLITAEHSAKVAA